MGGIIDLIGSDSEGEHSLVEEELEGMEGDDLEEQRVLKESIELAHREEEGVHRVVEDLLESLHEDRLHAWLRAKNKGMKSVAYP
jgi:hypothetical protein